ncbi:DUF523 domain-containing protein [Brevibacillus migulae]|uniref:DUF523 domain-containing protein n=1 Tax=Brevibacillus migulae TaxID=1644114 RepID=UPI00106F05E4|nr:DUF523 domain-containing protein [Brevibacillus migulae]
MHIMSACLAGCHCRYDGKAVQEDHQDLLKKGEAIPACPEQLGGLSTPRNPAEIVGGDGFDVLDGKARVMDNQGNDVTEQFIAGAQQALRLAKKAGVTKAILKENSPSCGSTYLYDGSFTGKKVKGMGVTAALFARNGIEVSSEHSL